MRLRHIVSITFSIILSLLGYLAYYLGLFRSVEIDLGEYGPFHLIYKNHVGAYHKIPPVIQQVEDWVKSQGLDCRISFGEYLDDPKQVEQERLRSLGGCVLNAPIEKIPNDFAQKTVDRHFFIHARFDGSPAIGPYKVYLKVQDLMKEKGLEPSGSVFEMYEIHSDKAMTTQYYFNAKLKN